MIEKASALGGDPPVHQLFGGDRTDHVLTVKYNSARCEETSEDMSKCCAVATPDVGDKLRIREIIGGGNGSVPIVRKVSHHRVEDPGFVRMLTQIGETVHVPSHLVRYPARHRDIKFTPSIP